MNRSEESKEKVSVFPLYQMHVGSEQHWLSLREAGITYDNGFIPVSIGGLVLEGAGMTRDITDEERARIAAIADEYSGSK